MKIVCTQENLKSSLASVARIVSSSNTLPILNNILLKTENGSLKISSTNLEIAINTQTRCKIEEEGEVTVPAKTITDLINNLPNKNIFLYTKNQTLDIITEGYNANIKTLPAEDFPLIPLIDNHIALEIPGQELKKSLEQTIFAVSTNQTQIEISGILFSAEGKQLTVVATDRYRLAEKKTQTTTGLEKKQVIVPQKTVVEVIRAIGLSSQAVTIKISETQICFIVEETQIISRLIDGQYPDYKQIIPTEFSGSCIVEKQAIVNALRTSGIFSQATSSVVFEYLNETQKLVLSTESSELGKSVVDVPAQVTGGSGKLILNYRYILDALAVMESEKIIIKTINDSSPTVVLPEGDETYIYLVMPIKN